MRFQWLDLACSIKLTLEFVRFLVVQFFGGLNVIAIGDFYQMHPVQDCYVFKNPGYAYECLAPNPWTEIFEIFSLTEIVRQKEDKYL